MSDGRQPVSRITGSVFVRQDAPPAGLTDIARSASLRDILEYVFGDADDRLVPSGATIQGPGMSDPSTQLPTVMEWASARERLSACSEHASQAERVEAANEKRAARRDAVETWQGLKILLHPGTNWVDRLHPGLRDDMWARPPVMPSFEQVRVIGARHMSMGVISGLPRPVGGGPSARPAQTYAGVAAEFGETHPPLDEINGSEAMRWRVLAAERDRVIQLYEGAFGDVEPLLPGVVAEGYNELFRGWWREGDERDLPDDFRGMAPLPEEAIIRHPRAGGGPQSLA